MSKNTEDAEARVQELLARRQARKQQRGSVRSHSVTPVGSSDSISAIQSWTDSQAKLKPRSASPSILSDVTGEVDGPAAVTLALGENSALRSWAMGQVDNTYSLPTTTASPSLERELRSNAKTEESASRDKSSTLVASDSTTTETVETNTNEKDENNVVGKQKILATASLAPVHARASPGPSPLSSRPHSPEPENTEISTQISNENTGETPRTDKQGNLSQSNVVESVVVTIAKEQINNEKIRNESSSSEKLRKDSSESVHGGSWRSHQRKKEWRKKRTRRREFGQQQGRSRIACTMGAVLRNATAVSFFIQYMETQSHAVMFIQFWLKAESCHLSMLDYERDRRENLGVSTCTAEALQADALAIYNAYFSLQNETTAKFLQGLVYMSGYAGGQSDGGSIDGGDGLLSHQTPMDRIRLEVENNICRPGGPNRHCFSHAQELCFQVMEKVYFPRFENSPYYKQYIAEEVSAGGLTLQDVLNNTFVLTYFTEYMANAKPVPFEGSPPNHLLQFWLNAASFKDLLLAGEEGSCSGEEDGEDREGRAREPLQTAQDAAMALYEKYISWQAFSPVNFPPDIRREVEGNICSEDGPGIETFETAQRYVFEVMEDHYFDSFMQSDVYSQFLGRISEQPSASHPPTEGAGHKGKKNTKSGATTATQLDDVFEDPLLLRNRKKLVDRLRELIPNILRDDTNYDSSDSDWKASDSDEDADDKVPPKATREILRDTPSKEEPWQQISLSRIPSRGASGGSIPELPTSKARLTLGTVDEWGNFKRGPVSGFDSQTSKEKGPHGIAQRLGLSRTQEEEEEERQRALEIAQSIIRDIAQQTEAGASSPSLSARRVASLK